MIGSNLRLGLVALFAAFASGPVAAFSIGTYQFDPADLASDLLSGSGLADNGTDFYMGTGASDWYVHDNGDWVPGAAPTEATDSGQEGATTFLAARQGSGPLALELGFGNNIPVNGAGADLAFFFLFDQTGNNARLSLNGEPLDLIFKDVFDAEGVQQVANGVIWDGQTLDNVRLLVAEVDLAAFGMAPGAALRDPVLLELSADSSEAMAFSMAGALNARMSPVPLPAALPLMLGGLSLLGLVLRRRAA